MGGTAAGTAGVGHGPAHFHRTAARRLLRRPAPCRPQDRGVRLRGVLPLRSLPVDGFGRRAARADRRVGDARRAGARDVAPPARHAGQPGDVPAARTAGDHRRAGRRDERGTDRAGPGDRMVRRRASGLRHLVPRGRRALRPLRRAGRDHRRPAAHPRRPDVLLRRQHYQLADSPALPKPVQRPRPPRSSAAPQEARCRAGGTLRRRVQRGLRQHGTAEKIARVRAAADRAGRTLTYSAAQVLCVGRDEAELARRAAAIGRQVGELRENGLAGTRAR